MYQFDGIIKIRNDTGVSIFTARPNLQFGKFYNAPNKDNEILPRDMESLEIKDNEHLLIHTCGRDQELAGTTGTIDLDDIDDQYIATLYWNVPFGSKTNTFSVSGPGRRSQYIVAADGYNRSGTGLGTADVEVTKKPTTRG
ncbi:hypothetical protein PENCOP_c001G09012 [Penicillium coprophilum]|uniref:Uncharacterized protein n=1 Tax=Penicillium coprophilum TaxID=36646 RepID=A0A1V6V7R7_9EURO|nr:hypothetical protein PENCOP_c001G09012 [Penicillium coprophilum]